jgi:UPF0042 nucleotide-binding protein
MKRRLLIISGLSGAGKSTAAQVFEDRGFFVVDNLPLVMLSDFMRHIQERLENEADVAVVIDVRNRDFLVAHDATFAQLKKEGYQLDILFLEAANDVLIRRYSETRRAHPLALQTSVQAGIDRERQYLIRLRQAATRVVDTSNLDVRQLRDLILGFLQGESDGRLIVNLESFGFRYGLPPAADLVFDVRFLPNPHYIDHLRPLTGLDETLRSYVLCQQPCRDFLVLLRNMLQFLLPHYRHEGKSYLTIAVGCTGGRHRSVSIAEDLNSNFPDKRALVQVNHRDICKG